MLNFAMPWPSCPCALWYPQEMGTDDYGNAIVDYADAPDWEGQCCYAPGRQAPVTSDDRSDGRPYGDEVGITVYLPKTYSGNPRNALIAVYPADDAEVYGKKWQVVGAPYSYMRAATPGNYSWVIEGVESLG